MKSISLAYCFRFLGHVQKCFIFVKPSHGQKKVPFGISFFLHLICCIKKTKCTTTCSVKSSTIYKVKLFLCTFSFQKKQNSMRPVFDVAKRSSFTWTRNPFFSFK